MALPVAYDDWVRMGTFLEQADGKVFYVHRGKGFPLLLLHFYGGNSWCFSRVLETLARHFSVYAMDLPGCAQSETPPFPYGPPDFAESLREFMDLVGIERAHLMGLRGSALTSVHFATLCPSRVGKLVLDGTPPWNRLEGRKNWREKMRPLWLDENELPRPFDQWSGSEERFATLEEEDRQTAIRQVGGDFTEHGRWFVTILKKALTYDVYTRLHQVQAPALLLYGERDWGKQAADRLLNGIVGSRLSIISGAGFLPVFEQPEVHSALVLDFLRAPA